MATLAPDDTPPLALTMGEPGGVGGELAVKAWRALNIGGPAFFLIDDPERLKALGAPVAVITDPREAATAMRKALPVFDIGERIDAAAGRTDQANALHVISSIERAVAFTLEGRAGAVVTNPIQKSSLIAAGFKFPGHTEFLGVLTANAPMREGAARGPVMMIAGPGLKTVPVTVHAPLAEAVRTLSTEAILHVCRVVAESLVLDFGVERPRLALSGLNPHAGEDDALGKEDSAIIAPAVRQLREEGVDARGPLPADTMFHAGARAKYDAAVCMYHDQALIPIKTIAFHEAVNVTLGLPIIRTSPDHGVAFDIAGKGVARADSLIAAIRLASEISARRAQS